MLFLSVRELFLRLRDLWTGLREWLLKLREWLLRLRLPGVAVQVFGMELRALLRCLPAATARLKRFLQGQAAGFFSRLSARRQH